MPDDKQGGEYLDVMIRKDVRAFIKVHSIINIIFESLPGQEELIPPSILAELRVADQALQWMVGQAGYTVPELEAIADDMNREWQLLRNLDLGIMDA